jgi:phosphatidylglycerol:prolipoprotein diacylglycerol transferase
VSLLVRGEATEEATVSFPDVRCQLLRAIRCAISRRLDDGRPGAGAWGHQGVGSLTEIAAGLFQFNVWSVAVPGAIVSGYWFALRRAREARLDTDEFESALEWAVGGGLVISHIVEVLLYQPERLKLEGVLTLFKFWAGLSSFGGFFGAAVMLTIFFRVLRKRSWWLEADLIMQGLVVAWIFGRLGCTLAGDHPGPRTDVAWAYPYPDGPRHNMGMYELLFTLLLLFPANLILHRRKPPVGSYIAMNCLLYGAGRFALDFARATDRADSDPRYFGLTLGQYCSLAVFLFGVIVAVMARGNRLARRLPTLSA